MNIDTFLAHHQLTQNPFDAEEARHDAVFERLMDETTAHPDLYKILGRIDRPSTAVVFGEKGSGKTAIRLLIGKRLARHNSEHPDARTLLVAYDDLNPVLDRIERRVKSKHGRRGRRHDDAIERILETVRLEDHQDGILSHAVTRLVNAILDEPDPSGEQVQIPDGLARLVKKMPKQDRVDMMALAALYDQPRTSNLDQRFERLRRKLRLRGANTSQLMKMLALAGVVAAAVLAGAGLLGNLLGSEDGATWGWVWPASVVALIVAGFAAAFWGVRTWKIWRLARRVRNEIRVVERTPHELQLMLQTLPGRDLTHQPWPISGLGPRESRYQLTNRLLNVLRHFGYVGMMVLVDRVDEPTLVTGEPRRMRAIVWPFFDNKFLQQNRIGIKLLLPSDLRPMLMRESPEFFQEARLDKQNLIDRLTWSGAMLYDVCTTRLRACRRPQEGAESISLTDLFDEDVTREMIVDALDQMNQPRDAFKFLYAVIQEHCRILPDDEAKYRIPRLVLDAMRRQQSQRVQDFSRGLSPS